MFVPQYLLEKKYSFVLLTLLACVFFVLTTATAFAATLQVTPASGSYSTGQTFTATIQVDPKGANINAVEAKLSFDTTKLSVVSVSKTGSAFSLWTTEPTFSNSAGTIDFGGGSPAPFSSRSTLISVTFRTVAAGSGAVAVTSASALAADGLGTDVYTGSTDAAYTVTAATTPPPAEEEEETPPPAEEEDSDAAITFGEPPRAPEVGSSVFLDPEIWYSETTGLFTWELPFDVDIVAIDIATSSEAEPTTVYDPPVEELLLTEGMLREGEQYLTMQYKNQVGWGAILHRKILIDSEPPLPFKINVRLGTTKSAFPLLTFEAKDTASGVERYEMIIADGEPIEITPDEAALGYLLGELQDGTYTISVTAYDRAGNTTIATVPVLIEAGWLPPVEVVATTSIWDLFKGKNLAILLLVLTIIALGGFIYVERKRIIRKEQKLRKETKEIQDQMEKIFSALRDEIYDQINAISKRPRLSKSEKEAVEGLGQALEVSETLIEKEISDVNKILK